MGRFLEIRSGLLKEVIKSSEHPCFDDPQEEEDFNNDVKPHLDNIGVFEHKGVDYDIYVNQSFSDESEFYFVSDSKYGYDLSVGINKEDGKIQINHVCKNPDSDRRGLPTSVYLDYLLPMKGSLYSDLNQTEGAFGFWQNLHKKVRNETGLFFYVYNYFEDTYKNIDRTDDMQLYYGSDGSDPIYVENSFVISKEEKF